MRAVGVSIWHLRQHNYCRAAIIYITITDQIDFVYTISQLNEYITKLIFGRLTSKLLQYSANSIKYAKSQYNMIFLMRLSKMNKTSLRTSTMCNIMNDKLFSEIMFAIMIFSILKFKFRAFFFSGHWTVRSKYFVSDNLNNFC